MHVSIGVRWSVVKNEEIFRIILELPGVQIFCAAISEQMLAGSCAGTQFERCLWKQQCVRVRILSCSDSRACEQPARLDNYPHSVSETVHWVVSKW